MMALVEIGKRKTMLRTAHSSVQDFYRRGNIQAMSMKRDPGISIYDTTHNPSTMKGA